MKSSVFHHGQAHSSRGFTLVEIMVVVGLMGIISISVIPAMNNLRSIREGAARDDIVRMIEITKGRAVASGSPHGLMVDLETSQISIYQVNDLGQVEVEVDPLTNRTRTIDIPSVYQGVTISSFVNGDGVAGSGILWFDYVANPHTRGADGTFIAINSDPVIISVSSGEQIYVYNNSGVAEVRK